ncbi:hypothetical protein GLOIN_2v1640016 [Rhizophagus irregularis DAOM 181602=DAOM 197198]|nr:hypothetical protein GLOIN_2v1640016 [Rhizophagus irregularis DAOM 181602=DAOM 197198]GET52297.1 hypothetical protein GLOIN_2v1640016 [Rhizophagus irregularis DAOM 181602=DAOM 197198]
MDGGIYLIGEHRGVKFVVLCKNFTEDKGGLSNYPPDTSKSLDDNRRDYVNVFGYF